MKSVTPGGLLLPTAGKPLSTVHQINNAAWRGAPIYAELTDGIVHR